MAPATLLSLRDRLSPPASAAGRLTAPRSPEVARALDLATGLFGAATVALVAPGPDGLAVAALSGAAEGPGGAAVAAARQLFEVLAAAHPEDGRRGGVVEEIAPGRGFTAAAPVLAKGGRCLGAVCLLDGGRRTLLTGMQRRLFAEFGDLFAAALEDAAASAPGGPGGDAETLQGVADAHPDAFAIFDSAGRCCLSNAAFDALVGRPEVSGPPAAGAGPGGAASWIAARLARHAEPVGVTRRPRADGTWLVVEERRGPLGSSLIARAERLDAFGSDGEMGQLFASCPLPMFVVDRDTSALLDVNDAALRLYGWERQAFLGLGLERIGTIDPARRRWTHSARDGRALPLAGRTVDLAYRGRPAVLVTVQERPAAVAAAGRAA